MARRTRVKICGITRLQDALTAQQLGVDSLGFVFVPASARYVAPEAALGIISQLSPFVSCVGLFLNESAAGVQKVLQLIPSLVPQFHGQESPEFCDQFNRPYLKAIGVGGGIPDASSLRQFRHATGFLFDSNEPGQLGGTGHVFDWHLLDSTPDQKKNGARLILAGGLDVENVAQAIMQVQPHAVDVSTGVESARGIKDAAAMTAFMETVASADHQRACS